MILIFTTEEMVENASHLYGCKMLICCGVYQDTIGLHGSEHQADCFQRRVRYEARVLDKTALNAIHVPYR